MDLLDFEADTLYFDEPLSAQAQLNIDLAAENYSHNGAELPLMKAYFLEPEHPLVLVALYRFFYYQHRLSDALCISERVIKIFSTRLALPADWNQITKSELNDLPSESMTNLRFYLLSLKGAGYLELRLGEFKSAKARLAKVVELDSHNHLGAQDLLDVANIKETEVKETQATQS